MGSRLACASMRRGIDFRAFHSGTTTSRRAWLAAAVLLTGTALAGCGSPKEAASGGGGSSSPLRVGVVYSQSGPLASYGQQYEVMLNSLPTARLPVHAWEC